MRREHYSIESSGTVQEPTVTITLDRAAIKALYTKLTWPKQLGTSSRIYRQFKSDIQAIFSADLSVSRAKFEDVSQPKLRRKQD